MLAGSGPFQYAQIGYAKLGGMSTTQTFTEYNDGTVTDMNMAHWWRTFFPGIWSSGVTHDYTVDYNSSTEKVYMSIGGAVKTVTPWSADVVFDGPWSGQFFGETRDPGDDISGTSTSRANFTNVAVRHCAGCLWQQALSPHVSSAFSYYCFVWTHNPVSFDVYTKRTGCP